MFSHATQMGNFGSMLCSGLMKAGETMTELVALPTSCAHLGRATGGWSKGLGVAVLVGWYSTRERYALRVQALAGPEVLPPGLQEMSQQGVECKRLPRAQHP